MFLLVTTTIRSPLKDTHVTDGVTNQNMKPQPFHKHNYYTYINLLKACIGFQSVSFSVFVIAAKRVDFNQICYIGFLHINEESNRSISVLDNRQGSWSRGQK